MSSQRSLATTPAQQRRLNRISALHKQWHQFAERRIGAPTSLQNTSLEAVLAGKRQMDAIRGELDDFLNTEHELRETRRVSSDRNLRLLSVSLMLLTLALGIVVAVWLFRSITALGQRDRQQAEAAFQERQWLHTTLQAIGDAVVANDVADRYFHELRGRDHHEMDRTRSAEAAPRGSLPHRQRDHAGRSRKPGRQGAKNWHGLRAGKSHTSDSKDGSEVSIDDSGAPISDSQGKLIGVVLVFRDIEEKRLAERAFEKSESRLSAFVDSIPPLAWTANADGWIFWYNQRWYEYTGATPEQMEGWGWQSVHNPDTLPSVMERWTASIKTGTSFEMIFPLRGADGTYRSFLTHIAPLKSDTGEVLRWFGTNTKVDELQRTREALREKNELIDLAQTAVNAGYWSYFPITGKCFLSPGEQLLFGLSENAHPSPGEIIELVHAADRENVVAALEKGMESGVYFAEFRVQMGDGSLRWLAGQGRVLTKDDGEKYMVGINFDVTNQKLSEEALRKSESLAVAGRMAAAISHEINNPLESVTNLLYLLRTNLNDDQSLQFVITAEEELARASSIVTQSLQFHRQSSAPSYEKLSTLLESAAEIYKTRTRGAVEVKRVYRDQNLVCCYTSELRQVFGKLAGNALD